VVNLLNTLGSDMSVSATNYRRWSGCYGRKYSSRLDEISLWTERSTQRSWL